MTEATPFLQNTILLSYDPRPQPEVLLIHMYRTTMHTMDTAITMMVAGAQ